METTRCPHCRQTIGEDEIFCPFCDEDLHEHIEDDEEEAMGRHSPETILGA